MVNQDYSELTEYLRGLGHTEVEIVKILDGVRQYDAEMTQDSVMNAIGNSTLDLAALIKEVLGRNADEQKTDEPNP